MTTKKVPIVAHDQLANNQYHVHYPDHAPRIDDPHYIAFEAYRKAHVDKAHCFVGQRIGFAECADAQGKPVVGESGLELHHKVLEFAVVNEIDLKALEIDYPNLTDTNKVGAWAETDANFMWLCAKHHRGFGGIHHAAAADWEASLYVQNLLSK